MSVEQPITHTNPDISVVIPTIPSNSHKKVINDLRRQSCNSFEAIVINDKERDICEARNVGIEEAKADIVALTDDDCRPPKQWVEQIDIAFKKNQDLVCLEGAVRGGREYKGERKYVGCNLAFDRQQALDIGGFNSEFAGWRDDTEFGWRMEQETSGKYVFSSDVVMFHPDRPRATIDDKLEEQLQYRYPDRYNEILIPDTGLGRLNNWLWQRGFWDSVNLIRSP